MKQLSYYLLFIIAVSVMVACSSEDDIFTDGYIANNGGSSGSGSTDETSELLSFTVSIDKTTAEPASSAAAQYPDEGDAPSYNSFGTTVNIDMSNPADPGVSGVTVTVDGNNVTTDHGSTEGVCYVVTGSTDNGSLQINGSTSFKLQLNNATIANSSTVALDMESKQSAYIELVGTNSISDGTDADDSHKGAIFSKSKLFIYGTGSLDVYGNYKNGIHGKSNVVIDKGVNLYVKSTENHGIKGGNNIYINGGIINVEVSADGGKGINCDADVYINGGRTTVIATGNGEWEEDETLKYGGDTKAAAGIGCDGSIYMNDGEVWAKATGSGGKGMKADVAAYINGGKIRIITTGGLYYNNGNGTESDNYTSNTDNVPNAYTSSPKGMKIGTKDDGGNTSGAITITGGDIMVRTSGNNAEGIESKGTLDISGGKIYIYAYDDGINSTSNLTVCGGTVVSCSKSNDGIDSNGNLYVSGGTLVAVGGGGAEAGIDSDESHAMTITGGTLFGIGGRIDTKFSNCTQAFAVTSGSVAANATITVSNSSGTTLGTLTMGPVGYTGGTILVSAPGMTNGGSYTLKTGSSSAAITGITTYSSNGMGGGGTPPGGGGPGF